MKAVFLDRDGTLNDDQTGYISDPKDFHLFPFAGKALKILNDLEYKTILVTNQSGIARGILTEDDLTQVHNHMNDLLKAENAFLDLILFSPFYNKGSVSPYNTEHISRKPNPGMFFDALKIYPIKAKQSYMIGDKPADIEFGKSNGLISILVKTGLGNQTWENRHQMQRLPDFVVNNLYSAAVLIKFLENQKKM